MPLETMASAISRTFLSSTRPANLFQLFQPMGGVSASLLGGSGFTEGSGLWVGNRSAGNAGHAGVVLVEGGGAEAPAPGELFFEPGGVPGPPQGPRPAPAAPVIRGPGIAAPAAPGAPAGPRP